MPTQSHPTDPLLAAHGLRRTRAARAVLQWLLVHDRQAWTHAELQAALVRDEALTLDRVTLYRLLDRLSQASLLLCTVDAQRVRHYRAATQAQNRPDLPSLSGLPKFECQACHRKFGLQGAEARLRQAAQSALKALQSIGHQGLSVDLSVRGVCVDCSPVMGRAP